MANEENLRPAPPWQPGQSGNPSGSSKKARFTAALLRRLDENPDELDEFIDAAMRFAKSGEFNYWRYIYERIEGKIPDPEPPPGEINMEAIARRNAEKRSKRKKPE